MNLLFSTAYAQEASPQGELLNTAIMIGGMIILFYFILWRPQAKRTKEHRELMGAITKGDEVMTSGGLLGRVTRVSDDYVAIEVAEGMELKLQKSAVIAALPKGTIKQI